MKYLVMECHLSYAVVLDSKGRFLKVANLGYEEGQTVKNVIMQNDKPGVKKSLPIRKHFAVVAAIAACLCFMLIGGWKILATPIGTVQIEINPQVAISVNRFNYAIDLEGLNDDGKELIKGVKYIGKKIDVLSDELADKAMEAGYLDVGGEIKVYVNSEDKEWKTVTEDMLIAELEIHFNKKITVTPKDEAVKEEPAASSEKIDIPAPTPPSKDTDPPKDTEQTPQDTDPPVQNTPSGVDKPPVNIPANDNIDDDDDDDDDIDYDPDDHDDDVDDDIDDNDDDDDDVVDDIDDDDDNDDHYDDDDDDSYDHYDDDDDDDD